MRFQIRAVDTRKVAIPPLLILAGMEAKPSPSKGLSITTLPTEILDLPTALQKYEITKRINAYIRRGALNFRLCEQINDYTYALFNGP